MTEVLHPGLLLVAAGLALAPLKGTARAAVALVVPAAAVALVLALPDGVVWRGTFLGCPVTPFAVDRLSRLFALVFAVMAFGGALFALRQESRVELPAAFVYAGSAIGVTLAGDLVTVFAFWELMAVGSTLVILLLGQYNLADQGYWSGVREFGLEIWQDWHRLDLFETSSETIGAPSPTQGSQ